MLLENGNRRGSTLCRRLLALYCVERARTVVGCCLRCRFRGMILVINYLVAFGRFLVDLRKYTCRLSN